MAPTHIINGITMELDTTEAIQDHMVRGVYEPVESGWARKHIGPGSVFVDVGANFGRFTTLALSLVGDVGHVYAFEPSPLAFAALRKALKTVETSHSSTPPLEEHLARWTSIRPTADRSIPPAYSRVQATSVLSAFPSLPLILVMRFAPDLRPDSF